MIRIVSLFVYLSVWNYSLSDIYSAITEACPEYSPPPPTVGKADSGRCGWHEACFLQQKYLTIYCGRVICCTENTVVMMDTAAAQLQRFAIEQETIFHICGNSADTKGGIVRIQHSSFR